MEIVPEAPGRKLTSNLGGGKDEKGGKIFSRFSGENKKGGQLIPFLVGGVCWPLCLDSLTCK